MTFNTQLIAKELSRGIPHTGKPDNYSRLPPEAKIAYFRESMQSILTHESTHLFQFMDNPDAFKYGVREKIQARALPLFVLSSTTLAALPLESREQIIIVPSIIFGTGLATIGGLFYLDKTGKYQKMQHEAYESQEEKANSNLRNPFTYTVESDPKPTTF